MGPTDGKVERDDELAIAHDPEEQDAIDAVHGVFEWAAPPSADESEWSAVLAQDGIIDDPAPLPATLGRRTFPLGVTPNGDENLQAQTSQAFKPGAFGQSAEEWRRDILVPAPHAGEFMAILAAKEGGNMRPTILPSSWWWPASDLRSRPPRGRENPSR